jgi:IclR family transcriptional regulator, KDG regulon repressor
MSVQSIDRTFDIIELLSRESRSIPMTEIGRRLDLHKSTVHRLLTTLRNRGYVEKEEDTGNYKLGLGFIELASLYLNSLELKTEAIPFLNQLTKQTGQTTFLATMDGAEIVYMDKVETYTSLRRYTIIGKRLPMHATSLGKAMLSGLENNEIEALYPERKLNLVTKKTIPTFDVLMKEIKQIRGRGWSIDDEENEKGTRCIGAPIFDYRDRVIAAISLAWDINVHPELTWNDYSKQVVKCAADISIKMGCTQRKVRQLAQ